MPLPVPPTDLVTGALRYYTAPELRQIDLKRRGVDGTGTHFSETMGPDGAGTARLYSCAWEERYAAACILVGAVATYIDSGKTRLTRLLPDTYSAVNGQQWVCTKVKLTPYRFLGTISSPVAGQDVPDFERCDIEATYELLPMLLREDAVTAADNEFHRYVITPGHPGAEVGTESNYIGLPGGTLRYVTATGAPTPPAGTPVPYPYGFTENITTKNYVWKRLHPDVWGPGRDLYRRVKGTAFTRGMIGALNKTEFDGHPPFTLQLRGVEERLIPDPLGFDYSWDLVYKMAEKPVPFGHLGFYFHSIDGAPTAGYYETLRAGVAAVGGNHEIAAGALADTDALFIVREFNELFTVEI